MPNPRPTRRQVLAGVGTASLLTTATLVADTDEPTETVTHTRTAVVPGPVDLRVDWRETYNGTVLEGNGSLDDGPPRSLDAGPVVSLPNVQPGDRGTLAVAVHPAEGSDGTDTASVRVRTWLGVDRGAENGRTEPELAAGDDTPDRGELPERARATLWYDRGALPGPGDCDGRFAPSEPEIASGSMRSVADHLAGGAVLGVQGTRGGDCAGVGRHCLGLSWWIPSDAGNAVQTDSVAFVLGFVAEPCT